MDGNRFDDLTKTLAAGASRRSVVRGAFGGLAGAALAALGVASAGAAPKDKANDECKIGCSGFNRRGKVACERACRACGGDIDRVCAEDGPFGPTGFVCCPEGTFCVGDGACCAEGASPCFGEGGEISCCEGGTFCDDRIGQCVSVLRVCFPAEAICDTSVVCSPESGCIGEECAEGCFCVSSVEGAGACVSDLFADCLAPSCETSADCGEGGTCVDASGCCGGAVAAGASPGWR